MRNVCTMSVECEGSHMYIGYDTLPGMDKWRCAGDISFHKIRLEEIDVALNYEEVW